MKTCNLYDPFIHLKRIVLCQKIHGYQKLVNGVKKSFYLLFIEKDIFVPKLAPLKEEKCEKLHILKLFAKIVELSAKNLSILQAQHLSFVLTNVEQLNAEKDLEEKIILVGKVEATAKDRVHFVRILKIRLVNVKNVVLPKVWMFITKFQLAKDLIFQIKKKISKYFVGYVMHWNILNTVECYSKLKVDLIKNVKTAKKYFTLVNIAVRNLYTVQKRAKWMFKKQDFIKNVNGAEVSIMPFRQNPNQNSVQMCVKC